MRLVLASNNAKKLAELRALLAGLDLDLVAQGQIGIAEAEEPHGTFIENALTKARHAARGAGAAAIADDSGLCVPVLGGEPGVRSAEFAGVLRSDSPDREERRRAQDAANNALLLRRLAGQVGVAREAIGDGFDGSRFRRDPDRLSQGARPRASAPASAPRRSRGGYGRSSSARRVRQPRDRAPG